jgi:hypothetical protein
MTMGNVLVISQKDFELFSDPKNAEQEAQVPNTLK